MKYSFKTHKYREAVQHRSSIELSVIIVTFVSCCIKLDRWRPMQLCLNRVLTFRKAPISAASFANNLSSLHQYAACGRGTLRPSVCQVLTSLTCSPSSHFSPFAGRTTSNKGSLLACYSIILPKKTSNGCVRGSYFLHLSLCLPPFTSVINPQAKSTNCLVLFHGEIKNLHENSQFRKFIRNSSMSCCNCCYFII